MILFAGRINSDTYYRLEERVIVRATNEVLSRFVNVAYEGGWVERYTARIHAAKGFAGRCGHDMSITEIMTKTLKPINQEQPK